MNNVVDNIPAIMTVEELADVLKIGMNSAYNLVRSGAIPCFHVGRQIRISRDALLEYIHKAEHQ